MRSVHRIFDHPHRPNSPKIWPKSKWMAHIFWVCICSNFVLFLGPYIEWTLTDILHFTAGPIHLYRNIDRLVRKS